MYTFLIAHPCSSREWGILNSLDFPVLIHTVADVEVSISILILFLETAGF